MRDLRADQTRLQKAVGTIVMGYRPTSGTERRAAVDYARRSLEQLTRGTRATFQLDRQRLETALLAKNRKRNVCVDDPRRKRLFDDFRRTCLGSKSKAGATITKADLDAALKKQVADFRCQLNLVKVANKSKKAAQKGVLKNKDGSLDAAITAKQE